MSVALAAVHHDPDGLNDEQARRILPQLATLYAHIVVILSPQTPDTTHALLEAGGATVQASADAEGAWGGIGRRRREAVNLALAMATTATHAHLCDFDRILHWAEFHSLELQSMPDLLSAHDLTVLGRTARAYDSHTRTQRDTEAIINHVFAIASGLSWDVSAAARGVSRQAAAALEAGCADDSIGNDCSWPLFVQQTRNLSLGYIECEGLEFETPDRYARQVAQAGGLEAWIQQIDGDPAQWERRLELARIEVASVVRYGGTNDKRSKR
jgi:hypothetical protein